MTLTDDRLLDKIEESIAPDDPVGLTHIREVTAYKVRGHWIVRYVEPCPNGHRTPTYHTHGAGRDHVPNIGSGWYGSECRLAQGVMELLILTSVEGEPLL